MGTRTARLLLCENNVVNLILSSNGGGFGDQVTARYVAARKRNKDTDNFLSR
jgi:hypothetical protein